MVNVYRTLRPILDSLFPPLCHLCGDPGQRGLDLCGPCLNALARIGPACPRCGLPLGNLSPAGFCGTCLQRPPQWDQLRAPYRYVDPLATLIQRLKFNYRLSLAPLLGGLLADALVNEDDLPHCLVPIPLHATRLRERGFNQAQEIARATGRHLGLAVRPELALRHRATRAQSELGRDERRGNVRDAFQASPAAAGRHVAIIDDVVSTGWTVAALARAFRRAGATHIQVWAVARAVRADPPAQ